MVWHAIVAGPKRKIIPSMGKEETKGERRDRQTEALCYHTYFQTSYSPPPTQIDYNICLKTSALVLVLVPVLEYGT